MAPELWGGEAASPASDQYALACVAYHGSHEEFRVRHRSATPRPIPEQVGPAVRDAVATALHKQAAARHSSVRAFLEKLGGADAFERSEAVTRILHRPIPAKQTAEALTEAFDLSDRTVALLTDLEPSEVIRQRRLAARRAGAEIAAGGYSPPPTRGTRTSAPSPERG